MNASHAKPRVGKKRLADRIGVNTAPIVGADGFGADPKAKRPKSAAAEATARASAPAATDANSVAQPRGREWTVTVALPGSIVDSAQTHELRSYLVGQVARACAIFNVDEIVLFATESDTPGGGGGRHGRRDGAEPDGAVERKGRSDGCVFMARLLQYIECPSYLRKHIFPHHPDLRCVGLLAPLEAPHHLRIDEESEYREAVVIEPGTAHSQGRGGPTAGADDAEASCGGRRRRHLHRRWQRRPSDELERVHGSAQGAQDWTPAAHGHAGDRVHAGRWCRCGRGRRTRSTGGATA